MHTQSETAPAERASSRPSYDHPRIYAIDCESSVIDVLRNAGYVVATGSLGAPYRLPGLGRRSNALPRVFSTGDLRGIDEQEIIVIDLALSAGREPLDWTAVDNRANTGFITEWRNDRIVDPRPLLASLAMGKIDKILAHGGVVIAFLGERLIGSFSREEDSGAEIGGSFSGSDTYAILGSDAWGMNTYESAGNEVQIPNDLNAVSKVLARHLSELAYEYKLEPFWRRLEEWVVTATNKYDEMIAGVMTPKRGGTIILLPRVREGKSVIVRELVEQALPEVAPELVPHLVNKEWLNKAPYVLPSVTKIEDNLEQLNAAYSAHRADIEAQLNGERKRIEPLQKLLTTYDRELVLAAFVVLRDEFGFENVIDVDLEEQTDADADLREDLSVPSTDPILLFEVKGIGGTGGDDDILQIEKAVTLHSHEEPEKRFKGVTLLNHQRHRLPTERDADFLRPDLAKILKSKQLALLTTWDMYRLVMNRHTHGWPMKALQDIFMRSGRIEAVPAHYEEIGHITDYYAKPFAVIIQLTGALEVGDRIAFERAVLFHEETVSGIRIDNRDVSAASPGDEIGIVSDLAKADARQNVRVFRIREKSATTSTAP
jgi:hypothetical protein